MYGKTKYMAERYLRICTKTNKYYLIARFFVYSKDR